MATGKTKTHYYVIVFTNRGAVYVTLTKPAFVVEWHKEEKPFELSKDYANDIVRGLRWNGYSAQVVVSEWEIDRQPYAYEFGDFEWHPFPKPEDFE